jgi:hypothetical protein
MHACATTPAPAGSDRSGRALLAAAAALLRAAHHGTIMMMALMTVRPAGAPVRRKGHATLTPALGAWRPAPPCTCIGSAAAAGSLRRRELSSRGGRGRGRLTNRTAGGGSNRASELRGAHRWDEGALRQLLSVAAEREGGSVTLWLDGVQDPHNLGACLRTADGAGCGRLLPASCCQTFSDVGKYWASL